MVEKVVVEVVASAAMVEDIRILVLLCSQTHLRTQCLLWLVEVEEVEEQAVIHITEAWLGGLQVRMEEGSEELEEIRRRVEPELTLALVERNSSAALEVVYIVVVVEAVAGLVGEAEVDILVVVVDPRILALIARCYKALPLVKAMASSKSCTQQTISAIVLPLVPQCRLQCVQVLVRQVPPCVLPILPQ